LNLLGGKFGNQWECLECQPSLIIEKEKYSSSRRASGLQGKVVKDTKFVRMKHVIKGKGKFPQEKLKTSLGGVTGGKDGARHPQEERRGKSAKEGVYSFITCKPANEEGCHRGEA